MTFRKRGHRSGFTFAELIVVISIISVLAAILFPVFAKAREKARQIQCLTNLGQIGLALSIYARDHCGQFPPTDDDLTPLLGRYLPMDDSLFCPTVRPDAEPAMGSMALNGNVALGHYCYEAGRSDDGDPKRFLAGDQRLDIHNDGTNCLFVDGHAKWVKFDRWGHFSRGKPATAEALELMKKRGVAPKHGPEMGMGMP